MSAALPPSPPRPRAAPAGLAVLALLVLAGLTWAKWWPSAGRASEIARTDEYPGSSILDAAGAAGAAPSVSGAWSFLVDYTLAIWPALVAALVLAAAVQSLLPPGWVAGRLGDRGRATTAGGAALALPGMMCSCCCAPLAATLRREGAALPAVLAFWVGNPLLNPAVLVFLALLAPWEWVGVRGAVGLVVVLGATAVVSRLRGPSAADPAAPTRAVDLAEAPRRFVRALWRLTVGLVPGYLLVVFVVGLLRGWLFPFAGTRAR